MKEEWSDWEERHRRQSYEGRSERALGSERVSIRKGKATKRLKEELRRKKGLRRDEAPVGTR